MQFIVISLLESYSLSVAAVGAGEMWAPTQGGLWASWHVDESSARSPGWGKVHKRVGGSIEPFASHLQKEFGRKEASSPTIGSLVNRSHHLMPRYQVSIWPLT